MGASVSKQERTLLISWRRLTKPPEIEAEPDSPAALTQSAFDDQHSLGTVAARERVQRSTGLDLDALGDETVVGHLGGFTAIDDPAVVAQRAVEGAWGPLPSAEFVSTEVTAPIVSNLDQGVDPRGAAFALRRLREGYQLRVRDPHGLGTAVADLATDLAMASGGINLALYYGIHSALGERPTSAEGLRLFVQLSGRRSSTFYDEAESAGLRLDAGTVAYIPKERTVASLPMDTDSLHLAIDLGDDPTSLTRSSRAMLPITVRRDWSTARAVIEADPEIGWPMRLIAPGGVQVVSSTDDAVVLAVGGHELHVEAAVVPALVTLADGAYRTGAALAEEHSLDEREVVEFCSTLWEHGLLEPHSAQKSLAGNERLTQVASGGPLGEDLLEGLLGLVDEGSWRAPLAGELPTGNHVSIDVQSVAIANAPDQLAPLVQIAVSMNQQFFRSEITSQLGAEPFLFVRIRASTSPGSDPVAWLDTLQTDIQGQGSTRKVTFAISLIEADGGWIHLPAGSPSTATERGMLSAWASLRPWTFSPVVEGERIVVLGRLCGPAFR